MRWFQRWLQRRSVPRWNTSQSLADFEAIFGDVALSSGVTVTPERALSVPGVFACIQVLSQDLARTPIKLRRKVGEDTYVDAVEHDLFEILHDLTNPETTAYQFKASMMLNLLAYGRAYAEIVRQAGRVTALWALDSRAMRVDRDPASRRKRWTYTASGKTYSWLFDPSRPPVFELVHETPIARCRELIGIALALQQYVARFFGNGARPAGVLETDAAIDLDEDQIKDLRKDFEAWHQGVRNAHRVAILSGGMKYHAIGAANDEAQLNETLHAINTQIAGAFRVPTWKIGDLSKTSYANMEAGELAYVTSTLDPLYQCWEDAIRRDLLTTRQFGQYQVQFDRAALIRSDVKAQHEAIAIGVNTGFYSPNDARRMLGLNPIDGGDSYRVNTALAPVSGGKNAT